MTMTNPHPVATWVAEGSPSTDTAWLRVLIFFFQAEDGIRDHCVTEVQTCALPILDERQAKDDDQRHGCAETRHRGAGHHLWLAAHPYAQHHSVHPAEYRRMGPVRMERCLAGNRRHLLRIYRLRRGFGRGAGSSKSEARYPDRHLGVAAHLHSPLHSDVADNDGTCALHHAQRAASCLRCDPERRATARLAWVPGGCRGRHWLGIRGAGSPAWAVADLLRHGQRRLGAGNVRSNSSAFPHALARNDRDRHIRSRTFGNGAARYSRRAGIHRDARGFRDCLFRNPCAARHAARDQASVPYSIRLVRGTDGHRDVRGYDVLAALGYLDPAARLDDHRTRDLRNLWRSQRQAARSEERRVGKE